MGSTTFIALQWLSGFNSCGNNRKVNNLESKVLSLFIGLAEIERMPYDKEHIIFKMMIGRLYNGKYKLKDLANTFAVSNNTIRKWGRALLSGDITQIEKAFGGHDNKRKLTSEIEAYSRGVFNMIGDRVKNFRQIILNEIESRYNVRLSGESLRPIFNDERIKSGNNGVSEERSASSSILSAEHELVTGPYLPNQETVSEINDLSAIIPVAENSSVEITKLKSLNFSVEGESKSSEKEAIYHDEKEILNGVLEERFNGRDLIVEKQSTNRS